MSLEAELTRLRHELQELDWRLSRHLTRGHLAGLGRSVTTAGSYLRDAWRENRSRVDRIREALEASGPLARSRVTQMFSTVDLSAIWDILISLCKDIALYYGGSVLTGAAIGGAIGAFAGGVGAAPGAAIGAGAGAKAGFWVLALLGLKSLAEDLIDKIPKMLRHYEQGIKTAWDTGAGTPRWHERGQCVLDSRSNGCFFAASELAQGHVILIAGLIMALTAYLTRGRGERNALLKEVAESPRLGPRVAAWLEQNAEKLAKPQGHRSSYGPRAGGPAVTPSQLRKELEAQRKRQSAPPERKVEASPAKGVMPQKRVRCFETNDLPRSKIPEFDRQLGGQERGLNSLTVDEYLQGRKAFDAGDTVRNPGVASKERKRYEKKLQGQLSKKLQTKGVPVSRAEAKASEIAAEKMKTLAALHNPDMVAGGKDAIGDFGDRNVNSRIGPQWKSRVGDLDEAARNVHKADRKDIKMNAKLERCR